MKINGQELHTVTWGNAKIEFRLRHSNRRTLAITVQPDLRVLVTAPRKAAMETVLARVRKRARWIRRQQRFFWEFLPQMPPRRYVSGETHRYLGRQYRIKVVEAKATEVKSKGPFIWVHTPHKGDTARVRKLVESWYLAHAKDRLTRSYAECAARMGLRLANPPRMQVRRMSKRWGSWTRHGGVWLSPELVKAPGSCIDYVVTHELCHAVHGHHGKRFYNLLRRVMPDWEQRKARLERTALD
jgi:hypothetical protein